MGDENNQPAPDLLGSIEAQLVEDAKAKIARDMAELKRLVATYPNLLKDTALKMGMTATPAATQADSQPGSIETLGELTEHYLIGTASPFNELRHNSRRHYATLMKLISDEHGSTKLSEMDANTLDDWYAAWKEGGKVSISYSKMTMLRTLFGFGVKLARDENCARLYGLLREMNLETPKARKVHLTREQADLIRVKARELNRPSFGLAQAFQTDLSLRQADVIGEWAPMTERAISEIHAKGQKWIRGLRWDEIGVDLILKRADGEEYDLKNAPMVLDELQRVRAANGGRLPSKGPVVVSEYNGLPYTAMEFRRWWRRIANECGIDPNVRNSDSRVRNTEAAEAPHEIAGGVFE